MRHANTTRRSVLTRGLHREGSWHGRNWGAVAEVSEATWTSALSMHW